MICRTYPVWEDWGSLSLLFVSVSCLAQALKICSDFSISSCSERALSLMLKGKGKLKNNQTNKSTFQLFKRRESSYMHIASFPADIWFFSPLSAT